MTPKVSDVRPTSCTVQFNSKVILTRIRNAPLTHPRHVLHAFRMHPACIMEHPTFILDASRMRSVEKRTWHLIMPCCSFIVRFCSYKSCACLGRISFALRIHLTLVPDVCKRYLGAELYRKLPLELSA